MKGVELPISTLVIVVIAAVILLAVLMLFQSSWGTGSSAVNLETVKNSACQMLLSLGCEVWTYTIQIDNFDADIDGEIDPGSGWGGWSAAHPNPADQDNLASLCWNFYNIRSADSGEIDCRALCNC